MAYDLTPNVCLKLQDSDDTVILASRPIVKVVEVEELDPRDVWGFTAQCRVTIVDGSGKKLQVCVPKGNTLVDPLLEFTSHCDRLQAGMVFKVNQMLRLPHGDQQYVPLRSFTRTVLVTHGLTTASSSSSTAKSSPMMTS